MFALFNDIGSTLILNLIQIIVGCILAIAVHYVLPGKIKQSPAILSIDLILITTFSVAGMLLPLGLYGVIPIIMALLAAGLRYYIILPLVFSNALFNMLVPFNDPGFIWRTGYVRVILALIIGIAVGLILRLFKSSDGIPVRSGIKTQNLTADDGEHPNFLKILNPGGVNFYQIGIYLIIGVILDKILHRYVLIKLVTLVFTNPYTSTIPRYFAGLNVVNPLFLLAMTIVTVLLDLTQLSALLALLKIKNVIFYYVYLAAWALLLGTSAFTKI